MGRRESRDRGDAERQSRPAERALRRADLQDERTALASSRRRHFRIAATWLLAGAVLSALGVGLGAWEWVVSAVSVGLLAVAGWFFIGANARDAELEDELARLDGEAGGDRGGPEHELERLDGEASGDRGAPEDDPSGG